MPSFATAEKENGTRQVSPTQEEIQGDELSKIDSLRLNINAFTQADDWVKQAIERRIAELEEDQNVMPFQQIADMPEWSEATAWSEISKEFELEAEELLLLAVVFTAQFQPNTLVPLWTNGKLGYKAGGKSDKTTQVVPTLRTILFLLAGDEPIKRAYYYSRLVDSRLFREQVLVTQMGDMDTLENQLIKLNNEYYRWLMNGQKVRIEVSAEFPANVLDTHLTMDDLVLKKSVVDQLEFLMDYVRHQKELYSHDDFAYKIKQGFVAMFYGPPGTGKTMTVSVMGKTLGMDVYSIDLSRVVSKYIGETEKNLEKIFQRLEGKKCILFFDEADALFGKRTEVKDAKDRYANQEVAYLLQKIERFPGLVILASNYNQNLDTAFKRRILSSIFFPPPGEGERLILWQRALPSNFVFEPENLAETLANKYQLTGANIANIMKLACLKAKREKNNQLAPHLFAQLIKLEQNKEKG